MSILALTCIFLLTAVLSILLAHRTGMGGVLGYLLLGIIVGQAGISVDQEHFEFSEFGVVMMLFLIGLDLKPQRLWNMRKQIFGLGMAQVMVSLVVFLLFIYFFGYIFFKDSSIRFAVVFAMCFSLSSTAIVVSLLNDQGKLNSSTGRASFAVLLFQDLAAMPMLAFLPLLFMNISVNTPHSSHLNPIATVGILISVCLIGIYVMKPIFHILAKTRSREIFTATSLLIVVSISLLMDFIGISHALGAFLAGVILANSEYRHELESSIAPFKGLLLGLFFITVGISMDINLLVKSPITIISLLAGVLALKFSALYVISFLSKMHRTERMHFAILLAQGSEFSFLLSRSAFDGNIFSADQRSIVDIVVTLSMISTPILTYIHSKLWVPKVLNEENKTMSLTTPVLSTTTQFDLNAERPPKAIIAGFGRFGQTIGRMLHARGIRTTVIDHDPERIAKLRNHGINIFYGDATKIELLESAGIDQAEILLIALEDPPNSLQIARSVKKYYPNVHILARAVDKDHAHDLIRIGAEAVELETFHSALHLARKSLELLKIHPFEARRFSSIFAKHNLSCLQRSAHLKDRQSFINLVYGSDPDTKEIEISLNDDAQKFQSGADNLPSQAINPDIKITEDYLNYLDLRSGGSQNNSDNNNDNIERQKS